MYLLLGKCGFQQKYQSRFTIVPNLTSTSPFFVHDYPFNFPPSLSFSGDGRSMAQTGDLWMIIDWQSGRLGSPEAGKVIALSLSLG